MPSEVNVSVSALENLISSLAQTIPMLDSLIAESESFADQAMQKVELTLDRYTSKRIIAFEAYQRALVNLEYSKKSYKNIPNYYYREVENSRIEYERLNECCIKLKNIRNEFSQQHETIKKQIEQYFESYSMLLNKANTFVAKYIQAINHSNRVLGPDQTGGSSSVLSSSSENAGNVRLIASWLSSINPGYNNPFTPQFQINCGSCAFAVESRLSGVNKNAVASGTNISRDEDMEIATGKKCIYMSFEDISKHLISQGAGSHLIVGITRHPTPKGKEQQGHWFNAFYDGQQIYTIDGQPGKIYEWPHDYGDMAAWCALI